MQYVFLWTDAIVYLVVVALGIALVVKWRDPKPSAWRHVLKRPMGMATFVLLLCFSIIGILDSLHYREAVGTSQGKTHYSTEVFSVLDLALGKHLLSHEKTYSAPFAKTLFTKDNVKDAQGKVSRSYLPLSHIKPLHLTVSTGLFALFILLLIAALVFLLLLLLVSLFSSLKEGESYYRHIIQGKGQYAWRTLWITLTLLIFLIICLGYLSAHVHILGTDKVGQDVFYQVIKSIRTGLLIGVLTTVVMLPFALFLGTLAGYFGGIIDDIIQYIYTTLSSVPGVLLIAASVLSIQVFISNHPSLFHGTVERADLRLLALCIILGITSWTGLCRVLRAETLKLRELDYIQAAKCMGVSHWKILCRHILPNVTHLILIAVVLDFSSLVLAEAVLSYIGVGVDPSMLSWGNMINGARLELAREPVVWWPLLSAFVFMFALVLSANLFADVVRDAFDPKMSGSQS